MGDLPIDKFIKTEKQKELYEKLKNFVKRKRWTEHFKEQWAISVVSWLETEDELKIIFDMLKSNDVNDSQINQTAFKLAYKRQHPTYAKKILKI